MKFAIIAILQWVVAMAEKIFHTIETVSENRHYYGTRMNRGYNKEQDLFMN